MQIMSFSRDLWQEVEEDISEHRSSGKKTADVCQHLPQQSFSQWQEE